MIQQVANVKNARRVWVQDKETGNLYEVDLNAPPRPRKTPYIKTDMIDPLWHPADGRFYDSKSKFRQVTKQHGYEERGGASSVATKKEYWDTEESIKADIEIAKAELSSGMAQLSERDREACKNINRRIKNR